jgi:hypothetical protein
MISFRLGDRTLATAYDFMHDLAAAMVALYFMYYNSDASIRRSG